MSDYQSKFKNPLRSSYKDKFIFPVQHKESSTKELHEYGNKVVPLPIQSNSTQRANYQNPHNSSQQWNIGDPRVTGSGNRFANVGVSFITSTQPEKCIDVKKFGCEKYLDIYATRNTLDHRHFESDEQRNDAITLWDWIGTHKVRGKSVTISDNTHRTVDKKARFTTRNSMQFVPNRGLLSEAQEVYSV